MATCDDEFFFRGIRMQHSCLLNHWGNNYTVLNQCGLPRLKELDPVLMGSKTVSFGNLVTAIAKVGFARAEESCSLVAVCKPFVC
jgi:hypothetical protein